MSFRTSTQSSNTDGPSLVPRYHVLSSSDVYQIVPSDDSNGSGSYLLNSFVDNPWSDDTSFQETDKEYDNLNALSRPPLQPIDFNSNFSQTSSTTENSQESSLGQKQSKKKTKEGSVNIVQKKDKKRNFISIEDKRKLIKLFDDGNTVAQIQKQTGVKSGEFFQMHFDYVIATVYDTVSFSVCLNIGRNPFESDLIQKLTKNKK